MTTAPTATPMPDAQPAPADPRFDTSHLRTELRRRSVQGGLVTLGSQGLKFVITIGSTAVLARLLTPGDFGLVAMVTAVVGFAAMFKDLGLSTATVQRERITHSQVSTLFWVNVGVSALLAVLVAVASPLVAMLYGDRRLVAVTVALGATFILGGATSQHTALLRRQMRFTALAVIEVAALALAVGVAALLAWMTRSYWALVALTAAQALFTMALAWAFSRWVPGRPRWDADVRGMLAFGGHLTGFNTLNYFTRNFDNVLVGAVLGAGPLGFYSRAYNLLMMPIRQVNGPISGVVMPALSALQRDPGAFRRYFVIALMLMTSISMPLVVFCMVEARAIVLAVLGPQWEAAAPIFLALGPAAFMGAFNVAPGWLYMIAGRTRALFQYGLVAAPLTVLAFVIGLNWGAVGVAWGFSAAFTACYIAIIPLSCVGSPVTPREYLVAMWRPAAASGIGACSSLIVGGAAPSLQPVLDLAVSAATFGASYAIAWTMLPGGLRTLRAMRGLKRPAPPSAPPRTQP